MRRPLDWCQGEAVVVVWWAEREARLHGAGEGEGGRGQGGKGYGGGFDQMDHVLGRTYHLCCTLQGFKSCIYQNGFSARLLGLSMLLIRDSLFYDLDSAVETEIH